MEFLKSRRLSIISSTRRSLAVAVVVVAVVVVVVVVVVAVADREMPNFERIFVT